MSQTQIPQTKYTTDTPRQEDKLLNELNKDGNVV